MADVDPHDTPEPPLVRDPDDRRRVQAFLEAQVGIARRQRDGAAGVVTRARADEKLSALLACYAPMLIGRRWPHQAKPAAGGGETPPTTETD